MDKLNIVCIVNRMICCLNFHLGNKINHIEKTMASAQ